MQTRWSLEHSAWEMIGHQGKPSFSTTEVISNQRRDIARAVGDWEEFLGFAEAFLSYFISHWFKKTLKDKPVPGS